MYPEMRWISELARGIFLIRLLVTKEYKSANKAAAIAQSTPLVSMENLLAEKTDSYRLQAIIGVVLKAGNIENAIAFYFALAAAALRRA
jgi:hypothetical protein